MKHFKSFIYLLLTALFFINHSFSFSTDIINKPNWTDQELLENANLIFNLDLEALSINNATQSDLSTDCSYDLMNQILSEINSPNVSPSARQKVLDAMKYATTYTDEMITDHFIFKYNASQVSNSNVISTSYYMEEGYDLLLLYFKKLKTDSNGMLTVYITPLKSGGYTNEYEDSIYLSTNSVNHSFCERREVSVHELFHRVQFAYGLDKGGFHKNQSFWAEGLAQTMEKYLGNEIDNSPPVTSYITYLNQWLAGTNKKITQRSYDAAYFWTYFIERFMEAKNDASIGTSTQAAKIILKTYKKRLSSLHFLNKICQKAHQNKFTRFIFDAHETALIKDASYSNQTVLKEFGFDDNNNIYASCNKALYTVNQVTLTTSDNITQGSKFKSNTYTAEFGGALYHQFVLDAKVKKFILNLDSETNQALYASIQGYKGNQLISWTRRVGKSIKFTHKFTSGKYDKLILVVASKKSKTPYHFNLKTNKLSKAKITISTAQNVKIQSSIGYKKWDWDYVITETNGVGVTFYEYEFWITTADGQSSNQKVSTSFRLEANSSITRTESALWIYNSNPSLLHGTHTKTYRGTDDNGNAVEVTQSYSV